MTFDDQMKAKVVKFHEAKTAEEASTLLEDKRFHLRGIYQRTETVYVIVELDRPVRD